MGKIGNIFASLVGYYFTSAQQQRIKFQEAKAIWQSLFVSSSTGVTKYKRRHNC